MPSDVPGITSARYLRILAIVIAVPLIIATAFTIGVAITHGELAAIPLLLLWLAISIVFPAAIIVFAAIGENIAHIRIAVEMASNARPQHRNDALASIRTARKPTAASIRNEGWLRSPGR